MTLAEPPPQTLTMPGYDNDESSSQPLLGFNIISNTTNQNESAIASGYGRKRRQVRALLSTNAKHYTVMGLVALDVGAILADLFVALVACDLHLEDEEWVGRTREGLHIVALVFSSLFLAELLLTVWAFGRRYVSGGFLFLLRMGPNLGWWLVSGFSMTGFTASMASLLWPALSSM